jgi:hypothetical protein
MKKTKEKKSQKDTEQLKRWDGGFLPYDKVETFNKHGYARVDKGGLLGLIRLREVNGVTTIEEYLIPSANRLLWRKEGAAVHFEIGTQKTNLNLPDMGRLPGAGTLNSEYDDPEELIRDIQSLQTPTP